MTILEQLGKNKQLSVRDYGTNDFITAYEVATIIENTEKIAIYFQDKLIELNSVDDFIDYLVMRKIVNMDVLIEKINGIENQKLLNDLIAILRPYSEQISKKEVIQFINENYESVFGYSDNDLIIEAISLVSKFQSGIHNDVFKFIINNSPYVIIDYYNELKSKIESEEVLLDKFFSEKIFSQCLSHRLDEFISFAVLFNSKKNVSLSKIGERITNFIISYGNNLNEQLTLENCINYVDELKKIYIFLSNEKHTRANEFYLINKEAERLVEEHLQKNGQVFSQEIPVAEIVEQCMKEASWPITIINVTHSVDTSKKLIVSRLSQGPDEGFSLLDIVGSDLDRDNYFTRTHQNNLGIEVAVGLSTLLGITYHSKEYFEKLFNWYRTTIQVVYKKINSPELDTIEDFNHLFQMVSNLRINNSKLVKQTLSFGLCVYICGLIEKTLRNFYFYIAKNKKYISISNITLGELINSEKNEEMKKVFGENHLKNLQYFLLSSGEKRIGCQYRNRLAHFRDLKWSEINESFAFKLLFFYTDILNTIFVNLYQEELFSESDIGC
ncbi:hypothetical protein CUM48_04270 [Enterococcus faecalis]|uniref:hypothetical protein n=1 Tax=Enterococcus faecalis TaxID=1351 RepID=UPI000CF2CB5F|nr:hypothetical protein [Enterococcus faecalis]EHR4923834.1 hypothetical protein [Enterococcus faecalis]PQD81471.1 hypothetical protein CUM48_04270 [Enterococcus faecalis]